MGLKLLLNIANFLWRPHIGNREMSVMFSSESFTIDAFALTKSISNEQIAWTKIYEKLKVFSFLFFSFYMWLRLLLAKLPLFIEFSKDIQIHNKRDLRRLDLLLNLVTKKFLTEIWLGDMRYSFRTVIFWIAEHVCCIFSENNFS